MAISKIVYKESANATPVTWMDATTATAAAADITAPKTAMLADGVLTTGTGSGGGGSTADYKAFIERTTNTPTLPSDLTSIAQSVCRDWSTLTLASLPNSVTSIGSYTFSGCSALALTSLPSSLTSIGSYAFSSCYNLAISIIPNGVTSIGERAFQYCESLETIRCDGAITSLGGYLFAGSSTHPMALREVYFPNMTSAMQAGTFGNTTANNACQNLEVVDLGKISGISQSAAFTNCYKLRTLILRRTNSVCSLSNTSAFTNTPMSGYNSLTGTVYVPNNLISSYQTATNWKTLYDAGYISFVKIEGSIYE